MPPELEMALQCRQWGTLPDTGGLLDQAAGIVKKMTISLNVFDAMRSFAAAGDVARWSESNPQAWQIVGDVMILRRKNDK